MIYVHMIPKGTKVRVSNQRHVLHDHVMKKDFWIRSRLLLRTVNDPISKEVIVFTFGHSMQSGLSHAAAPQLEVSGFRTIATKNEDWPYIVYKLDEVVKSDRMPKS